MSYVRESILINGKPLTFETGRLAKQAHGSVLVTYGESVVLITAVSGDERPGIDFFPLTCEYVEKTYAAGKIPGGFFKREARQRDEEILVCRLMDRPCRPLFPEGFKSDTQVIATVLSSDKMNPTDVLAVTGASCALHLSDIPWAGPLAGVRVARVNGEFVAFPTFEQQAQADIDVIVACSKDAINMVEGGAAEVSETDLIDALMFAHKAAQPILELIEKLRAAVGKPKRTFERKILAPEIKAMVKALCDAPILEASLIKDKKKRYDSYKAAKEKLVATLTADLGADKYLPLEKLVKEEFEERKYVVVREYVLSQNKRIDGRAMNQIRAISNEVGLLPRVHGSSLFQRGETQAIVTTTLGTSTDEQKIDALTGERWKRFLLHYNFPPFSTGETKPMRGPGRREIGHGALAERALLRMMPDKENFPYTIRIVSEILESNGSSSMASVCGGSMSMMDAGVPIKAPVAGIAMGLIEEGSRVAILSDILGDEDHLGDMDFKVAGTRDGVTAVQMDIKVRSVDWSVMERALEQARQGRLHILDRMEAETQADLGGVGLKGRAEVPSHAPRMSGLWIKPDRIRDVIGPGGRVIRAIQESTGAKIDIEDNGQVRVFAPNADQLDRARAMIEELTQEAEIGRVYLGKVKRITDFGAFVEIFPGTDGMIHISHLADGRVEKVTDVLAEGDEVLAKCIDIDPSGRIRLSRKEALADLAAQPSPE
jgi:polyribonucleotide nucleotidyltransferase